MHILIIKTLLLPPAINLLIVLLALLCWRLRYKQLAVSLLFLSFLLLWLLSTPLIAHFIAKPLVEQYPALTAEEVKQSAAEAIVVLGSGIVNAPEYDGVTIGATALVRVRYAGYLAQLTGLPVLLSGDGMTKAGITEAALMQYVLEVDYGVRATWLEENSLNTEQNARLTARILSGENIKTLFLVTNALHMPRAMLAFKAVGLEPIAAPTGFQEALGSKILLWLPQACAFLLSRDALHEYMGMIWLMRNTFTDL